MSDVTTDDDDDDDDQCDQMARLILQYLNPSNFVTQHGTIELITC